MIFLVRRPEDMLASNAGTNWYRSEAGGPEGVLATWSRAVESFAKLRDPRLMALRYEALTMQPQAAIQQLAALLEIAPERFNAGLLEHRVRGDQGPPALGRAEITALSAPGLEPLARLHYPDWRAPAARAEIS